MSLETWWSAVRPETRDWLVAHNGEPLPPEVVDEIIRVAGPVRSDSWWVGSTATDGLELSDAAVDWIEAAANDEEPPPPPGSAPPPAS